MAKQYQLVFNCTPAQLETALITTLPATGWAITRAPNQYTGLMIGTAIGTGTAAEVGADRLDIRWYVLLEVLWC